MIVRLAHRGPDENGTHTGDRLGLAHVRLSIIDLAGGQQPMSNADGSLWITFSGEIFNYCELREELQKKGRRFATRSDTEVLLQLYDEEGEDCVHRLNGQWAFAIWDARQRKLFLSRDRLGVRPLFYTITDGIFIFASEIKAIFACPQVARQLDLQALEQICTFWVTVPPRTIFKNIWQLPPGHSLTIRNDQIRVHQYWKLEYPAVNDLTLESPTRKAEELLELMFDAVRVRLRADVAVGTYLSGGIDSTFVTALTMKLLKHDVQTFSLKFEDCEFDESSYQRQASAFLNTKHREFLCTSENIGQSFDNVVWHSEQPILRAAPAPLYLLAKFVRQNGLKVILTGEGSDEILGGYDIFKEAKIRRFWQKQPDSNVRPILLKTLYPYMKSIQSQSGPFVKNFFRVGPNDLANPFFSHLPRWELTSKLKSFFSDVVMRELADYDAYAELRQRLPDSYSSWHPFCQAQYLETMYLLPGYILSSQGDRMAMAHAVETRHPFLDHRVVDFGASLHPSLKMRVLNEKFLLKRASTGLMPPAIIQRSKQPYRTPDALSFVNTRALPRTEELLAQKRIRENGVFDPSAVFALLTKFKSGRAIGTKDSMALTGILSTQIVMEQFIAQRGTPYAA